MTSVLVFDLFSSSGGEASLNALVDEIKAGCKSIYFGRVKEDEKVEVLCSQWASAEEALTYTSPHSRRAALGHKDTQNFGVTSSVGQVLTAPCTEVFTAYDAQDGFEDNLARFVEKLAADSPKGYFGSMILRGLGEKEKTFRMLLGWENVEAHLEAKAVVGGVIQANIHELREKRGAVDLFHVEFKERWD